MSQQPLVSVIVTTKNESEVVGRLLSSVRDQSYPSIETILVDNSSTDQTKQVADRFTKLVYVFGPERSAQRNFGAQKSQGKYLLFLDADMELEKNVVADCVRVARLDSLCGGVVIPEESVARGFWEKVKAFERSFYNLAGDEITDAARFFPKEVFNLVDGYDESITGPEDWDLPEQIKREGFLIRRISSKIYHYERIKSLFSLIRKKYYYGKRANQYLTKQQISPFSAKTIYFFRPVFYRNWRLLFKNPVLSIALLIMLTAELIGGGTGFLAGRAKAK